MPIITSGIWKFVDFSHAVATERFEEVNYISKGDTADDLKWPLKVISATEDLSKANMPKNTE